jgi:hypothetical protein
MRGLKEEFGGHGYTVPQWVQILVKGGFLKDTSWHNDVCPSFEVDEGEEAGVRLWIDHIELSQRECETPRFVMDIFDIGDIESPAYAGDDVQQVVDILFKTDYDLATEKYYVRLIGADKKVAEGFDDETFSLMWIDNFIEDNSKEVDEC